MSDAPDLAEYGEFLRAHGVPFRVSDDLARHPDHHGDPHADARPQRTLESSALADLVEYRVPEAALSADHATLSVARVLVDDRLVRPGSTFWEIGCGTGLLAILAAKLGAAHVVGTDLDPRALELARRNAAANGVEITTLEGPLLDPLPADATADLVVANLPHKPRRRAGELVLAQDGGKDGTAVLDAFFEQLEARRPGRDRVVFFLHSLPHPRLLRRAAARRVLTLRAWKRRYLGATEYGDLQDWFADRAARGEAWMGEDERGRYLFAGVWSATAGSSGS